MRDLPIEMKFGLREFGFQEARLSKFGMRTRVMRDMRICPSRFAPLYQCLVKAYDSANTDPEEVLPSDAANDCLWVTLGGFASFFDRYIETPDVTLAAIDRHLRS